MMENLRIKQDISIRISNVVPKALLEIGHHVDASSIKHSLEIANELLGLRPRDRRLDGRTLGLAGVERLVAAL